MITFNFDNEVFSINANKITTVRFTKEEVLTICFDDGSKYVNDNSNNNAKQMYEGLATALEMK